MVVERKGNRKKTRDKHGHTVMKGNTPPFLRRTRNQFIVRTVATFTSPVVMPAADMEGTAMSLLPPQFSMSDSSPLAHSGYELVSACGFDDNAQWQV